MIDLHELEESNENLQRKLKTRHITMIAIGGIISPGLLVGSGTALSTAGPVGSLIAFATTGVIIFFVMQSLGEICTAIPVSGAFTDFADRFCDPSLLRILSRFLNGYELSFGEYYFLVYHYLVYLFMVKLNFD